MGSDVSNFYTVSSLIFHILTEISGVLADYKIENISCMCVSVCSSWTQLLMGLGEVLCDVFSVHISEPVTSPPSLLGV